MLNTENENAIKAEIKEYQRIKKLSEFDLDYTDLDEYLKNYAELAAKITGTPISIINLIDSLVQWSVSTKNSPIAQTPREDSACTYTIETEDYLEIARMDLDDRFKDKAYVNTEGGFKYYLGIPLTLDSGDNIGSICVLDTKEKSISNDTIYHLKLIANEIVQKLEMKKKMRDLNFSLVEAVKIKNQVAHDIRGPIHGIVGLSEMMKNKEISEEELIPYIELIHNSGKGLMELTTDILNGDMERQLTSTTYNLKELGDHLLQLYKPGADLKNITLQVEHDSAGARQRFSKKKLLSIIGNLISNAIKFTGEAGTIKVLLDIKVEKQTKLLLISVSDNGKGLPHSIIETISCGCKSAAGTLGEKGFGLGLMLVDEMVNSRNGSMKITSDQSLGTEINISIPLN